MKRKMKRILDYINENLFDTENDNIIPEVGQAIGFNGSISDIKKDAIVMNVSKSAYINKYIVLNYNDLEEYIQLSKTSGIKKFEFLCGLEINVMKYNFQNLTFNCLKGCLLEFEEYGTVKSKLENLNINTDHFSIESLNGEMHGYPILKNVNINAEELSCDFTTWPKTIKSKIKAHFLTFRQVESDYLVTEDNLSNLLLNNSDLQIGEIYIKDKDRFFEKYIRRGSKWEYTP